MSPPRAAPATSLMETRAACVWRCGGHLAARVTWRPHSPGAVPSVCYKGAAAGALGHKGGVAACRWQPRHAARSIYAARMRC